jgi:hypothetical protein
VASVGVCLVGLPSRAETSDQLGCVAKVEVADNNHKRLLGVLHDGLDDGSRGLVVLAAAVLGLATDDV